MDIAARGYVNSDLLWSPETLRERLGRSGLVVIDTRPAEMFAKGRIPGARHFDPYFVNTDDTDPATLLIHAPTPRGLDPLQGEDR